MAKREEEIVVPEVVNAEIVDAELVEDPEPLMRLRASIYETEKGGLLLAFRFEGMEHDGHFVLKATMVKLLAKLAPGFPGGANPIELLRQAKAELAAGRAQSDEG